MSYVILLTGLLFWVGTTAAESPESLASWYGEELRGRPMANGQPFNPDRMTAASWFYPLGSRVRVTLNVPGETNKAVEVTITDRGPAWHLVRQGRVIDLGYAAFKQLAEPRLGLIPVQVEAID